MAMTINDDSISSDRTSHTARPAPGDQHRWEVSWLPDRHLTRNDAITAMVLADITGPGDMHPEHQLWPHVQSWAAELGITGADALDRTATTPTWSDPAFSALPTDPEAGE
jgi:hypothetical protein